MTEAAIAITALHKSFGAFVALNDVNLTIPAGQRRAIIGPNGAGKSTLLNVLNGQLPCQEGSIHLFGRDVTKATPHELARLGIGRTFQISSTFRHLSVEENVRVAHLARVRRVFSPFPGHLRALKDDVAASLEDSGLTPFAQVRVSDLSHGDRKKLELAMALATKPRVLLLDEPTAGMGLAERQELMDLVVRHVARDNLTMIFVEHDIEAVFRHADLITVMAAGTVFAEGTPAEISTNPEVQRIYLGSHAP